MGSCRLAKITPPNRSPGCPEGPSILRKGEFAATDSGPAVGLLYFVLPTAFLAIFAVGPPDFDRPTAGGRDG